jgi:hypothetical protein
VRPKPRYKSRNTLKLRVYNKLLYETDMCLGRCWPGSKTYRIEIDPRQCPQDYMDTLIHECIHEIYPKHSESSVRRAATTIANVLWRLGYRKKK